MAGTSHSNAGKILLSHYMEGALRILREMAVDDCLPIQQVINHKSHLIQIACLAQTTPRSLVRIYDTIYRREQHQYGFAWASTSAFIIQLLLSEPQTLTPKGSTITSHKRPHHPSTGKPVCLRWNSRKGCNPLPALLSKLLLQTTHRPNIVTVSHNLTLPPKKPGPQAQQPSPPPSNHSTIQSMRNRATSRYRQGFHPAWHKIWL